MICSKCGDDKAADEFPIDLNLKRGRSSWCRDCRRVGSRASYHKHGDKRRAELKIAHAERMLDPEKRAKHLASNRRAKLAAVGLTVEQYDDMLADQGGGCAICGGTDGGRRLAVDHDHATGQVRGLLCTAHNLALGSFRDDVTFLRQAIVYLERGITTQTAVYCDPT